MRYSKSRQFMQDEEPTEKAVVFPTKKEKTGRFLLTSIILHIIAFVIMANFVISHQTPIETVTDVDFVIPPKPIVKERKPPKPEPPPKKGNNLGQHEEIIPGGGGVDEGLGSTGKPEETKLGLGRGEEIGTGSGVVGKGSGSESTTKIELSKDSKPVPAKKETEVIIGRLGHNMGVYHRGDEFLVGISKQLDVPGKDFVVQWVRLASTSDARVLFLTSSDPDVAGGGLVQGTKGLRESFDDDEKAALKEYIDGGGTLFVICASPGGKFYDIIKKELTRIFGNRWERIPSGHEIYAPKLEGIQSEGERYAILLSKEDLFQSQDYRYFKNVLSYASE